MKWPESLGVCVKDKDGRVLEQNAYCRQICGNQKSSVCRKGCMLFRVVNHGDDLFHDGLQVHKRRAIEGQMHDVLLIESDEKLISILYPLKKKLIEEKNFLHEHGLSHREQEIGTLIMEGRTNAEIAAKLHIAPSTLKTHINNIYRKLPNHIAARLKQRSFRKNRS